MRAGVVLDGRLEELPAVLTVEEAARVLRIGRSLAYQLANRYVTTGGIDGLPVVRLGGVLRVPGFAVRERLSCRAVNALSSRGNWGINSHTPVRRSRFDPFTFGMLHRNLGRILVTR